MTFVKSASTGTSVESSRAELNKVLSRYGCTAFGYEEDADAGVTRVTFRVPDSPEKDAAKVPVRLEVKPMEVYARLYGRPTFWDGSKRVPAFEKKHYDSKKFAQAERVAWRHLILWVDAACTAASAGMTTMREAFHANVLVRDEQGRVGRMVDYVQTLMSGEGGPRLLGPGGD
jgi:hypothetical protein